MLEHKDFSNNASLVIKWIQDFYDKLEEMPVKSIVQPGEILQLLEDSPPMEGIDSQSILNEINNTILPGITHWQHPNFHAYFPANSSVESVLAEMVTSAIAAQCMIWDTSPAAAELEEKVLGWLGQKMGIPKKWEGVIQDTASTATLTAILTAREIKTGFTSNKKGVPNNLRVYCSTQTHSSIEKAVAIAGIGTDNLVKISVDSEMRMVASELELKIRNDIEEGRLPCCIISAVGTTGTVAIDPVKEISTIARKYNVWHHIDAAYAGTALILPEYHWMIEGVEQSDSFVFNPHKWMFTNFDCTVYFVKDASALIKTFEVLPEYLKTKTRGQVNDYRDWGIPLGRRFRALKLWWVIKSYGIIGIQQKLRKHISLNQYFCEEINKRNDFIFLTPPILNFSCIQWKGTQLLLSNDSINNLNEKLKDTMNNSNKVYISHTLVNNSYGLRLVFGNTYIEKKHVNILLDSIDVSIKKLTHNLQNKA